MFVYWYICKKVFENHGLKVVSFKGQKALIEGEKIKRPEIRIQKQNDQHGSVWNNFEFTLIQFFANHFF